MNTSCQEASAGWVRVKLAPVFAIDGRFDGVLVTCERIDRERFAQNSLGALRQALESVGEMVFEIDASGAVVDANDAARQRLGYDRESLKGMSLTAIDVSLAGVNGDGAGASRRCMSSCKRAAPFRLTPATRRALEPNLPLRRYCSESCTTAASLFCCSHATSARANRPNRI